MRRLISRKGIWRSIAVACGVVAVSIPFGLGAVGLPSFPAALQSSKAGTEAGIASQVSASAQVQDAVFHVTSVLSDPEQTVLAYSVEAGQPGDKFVSIAPRPRLLLEDGTLIDFEYNLQEPGTSNGSLIFAGVPEGVRQVRLEVDGLQFATGLLQKQVALKLTIDNRKAYGLSARSDSAIIAGEGKAKVTISSIARTPSLVVIRGTFDSMTSEEIQQLGRPDFWLTDATGKSILSESGRLGFGEGYRSFEFRFSAVPVGSGTLELRGFTGPSSSVSSEFRQANTKVPLSIP